MKGCELVISFADLILEFLLAVVLMIPVLL